MKRVDEIMESQASAFCHGVLLTGICSQTGNVLEKSIENKFPQQLFEVLCIQKAVCGSCVRRQQ